MGLFFKKKTKEYICPVCGKTDNYEFAVVIKDNQKLCRDCTSKVAIDSSLLPFKSVEDIKNHFIIRDENLKLFKNFSTTREIKCSYALFREDANMKKWYYCIIHNGKELGSKNPTLFNYEDIVDYELTIDDEQVAKGGLGSAVAGGVMFGGVGAIVGSNVGKKTTNSIIKSMQIRISLNHPCETQIIIAFETKGGIKAGGYDYNKFKAEADNTFSFLDSLCAKAKAAASATPSQPSAASSADEILKFKNLLDSGIISQEEFDAKKKQLLGL